MDLITDFLHSLRFEAEFKDGIRFGISLAISGGLGSYLTYLYKKLNIGSSNAGITGGTFPLLIMITACVIAVVKASLALSLGLVGALSIVRFRAAIKDPEELVWLFLCIAVGLSIGAGHLIYAVVLVFIVSAASFWKYYFTDKNKETKNILVTISGDVEKYFSNSEQTALQIVENLTDFFSVQRYEIEGDQGYMRIIINKISTNEMAELFKGLHDKLPDCHISYTNMNSLI